MKKISMLPCLMILRIKRKVNIMFNDVENYIIEQIKKSIFYMKQLNKFIDTNNELKLLFYILRYVNTY